MNLDDYKQRIMDRILYESPKYIEKNLLKEIKKYKIGEDKKNTDAISLLGMPRNEKIIECFKKNNRTINVFDEVEINKGYKYSLLYRYKNLQISNLESITYALDSEYYECDDIDMNKPILYENEKVVCLKFHRENSFPLGENEANLKMIYTRCPVLCVIHKKYNILEIRFDEIHKNNSNDTYYKTLSESILSWIHVNLKLEWEPIKLDSILKDLLTQSTYVKELVWSFELAKSKGIVLKVGEDGIMPFIDEMRRLLNDHKESFFKNDDTKVCYDLIDEYLNNTQEFSNAKFRLIEWKINDTNISKAEKSILTKIIFNYDESGLDLINIYDNEINDMERINYVIKRLAKYKK